MSITRENYEAYFLDYTAGNLNEDLIDKFLDFLENNPDLKSELQMFESIELIPESIPFDEKKRLYQSEADENLPFIKLAIAEMEGDLNPHERIYFEELIGQNPIREKELDQLKKTRLVPDPKIVFLEKQKLYRANTRTIVFRWVTAIAAILVVALVVNSLLQSEEIPNQIASKQIVKSIDKVPQKDNPEMNVETKTSARNQNQNETVSSLPIINTNQQTEVAPPPTTETIRTIGERKKMEPIAPILAQLETPKMELIINTIQVKNAEFISENKTVLTIDEYLAIKANELKDEGRYSAQKIFRNGLDVASDLSGNRIAYQIENGKVSKIEFESKLFAFSVPVNNK
jgi:hypothetical protein